MAIRPYPLRQHDRRVAEAGARIHHTLAIVHLELREDRVAVLGKAANQHVLVLDEFGDEDFVPELDELGRRLDRGFGHDGHAPLR